MSNVKRYYSFFLGIIAASVTWSVVIYFYLKLGSDASTNISTNYNYSIQNSKEKLVNNVKNYDTSSVKNNLSLLYHRKKYYKNSEKLIKELQAKLPATSEDLGEIFLT